MSTADRRVTDLLDRWQRSVELHSRFLELDDAAYRSVQDWPPHQRPTRWVLELASSRLEELRRLHAERQLAGDAGFAEALELMGLLANLLGAEHIERFVPLAKESPPPPAPVAPPEAAGAPRAPGPKRNPAGTRRRRAAPQSTAVPPPAVAPDTEELVIADAVRFLGWGREWPTLAGLIARRANRPDETVVWEILRRNRQLIESRAAGGTSSTARR